MSRLLPLSLLVLSGCLSFDGLLFPAEQVDRYALDFGDVPDELVEEVSFESTDGTLLYGAWARQSEPTGRVLVYFHGYGQHIDHYADVVEYLWSWGTHDVFLFDYRGYGRSEGTPTRDGVLEEDGLAAVQYVSATSGLAPEAIDWLGLSLGGSVATHTGDEIAARSIVLESMFASVDHIVDGNVGVDLPHGWFFEEEFDNVEAASKLISPVFVLHGLDDDFVSPESAPLVYEAAPEPKALWQPDGVKHDDAKDVLPEEYRERILGFQGAWGGE